jgi:hypothetical protein
MNLSRRGLCTDSAILELGLDVGTPVDLGIVNGQGQRLVPILGGTFSGQHSGNVLPGGADWQTVRPDGVLELDARYVLSVTGTGSVIEVRSEGIRSARAEVLARLAAGEVVPPREYYFRTFIRFRTADPELSRLNTLLALAVGERLPNQVRLKIYPVL